MRTLRQLTRNLVNAASTSKRLALLQECIRNGLPVNLAPGLEYLITGKRDASVKLAASEAERRRAAIASQGKRKVPILYSPKPGSAGGAEDTKPMPGKVLEFTMERIARTGKCEKWGTAIFLLVREFQCERGIELGSCAGISALYLSSAPSLKELVTVEGSSELARIAEESLKDRSKVTVVNSLFDDAIDNHVASSTEHFDLAFIDGHHEKVATIHYFNRLTPFLKEGSLVIFDDVSWSYDMREAWEILSERSEFSHTVDLGAIGVCVMKSNSNCTSPPRKWNLQFITGVHAIGDPLGWKE
jgi:predicted O-methyltransferase YrrM